MEEREKLRRQLEAQIAATERHLSQLKQELADLETQQPEATRDRSADWPLLQDEYRRYGRQMIVEQVGLPGKFDYNLPRRIQVSRSNQATASAYRPASTTEISRAHCRSRRTRLSSSFISCRCRSWKAGDY